MKFYKFSKPIKAELAVITVYGMLSYALIMTLFYILFGESKFGIILDAIITAPIIGLIVYITKKRGVYMFEGLISVSGGKNLKYVKYENIYSVEIITDKKNEGPLRKARIPILGHPLPIPPYLTQLLIFTAIYSFLFLIKKDDIKRARFAGGRTGKGAEYIKLSLDINDEDYYLYFSLEDNKGFVEALNKKLEEYPFVEM